VIGAQQRIRVANSTLDFSAQRVQGGELLGSELCASH
jgi:hypothetical protein